MLTTGQANFNLDLDSHTRRRSLTPAISRLVLFATFYAIYRKASRQNAPLYAGLALRFVPTTMFFLFKGIYLLLRLYFRRNSRLTTSPAMPAMIGTFFTRRFRRRSPRSLH